MKIKIDNKLIEQGYISKRKHPEFAYYIYNYTPKTQYSQMWNEDTMRCRGLILDGEGNVIARPFKKFFNLEEYVENSHLGKLPEYKSFDAYEKMDGSLGILYLRPDKELSMATRGSFESEQAKKGEEILNKKYGYGWSGLRVYSKLYTFLFEIIYPENRIVVNYGKSEDIILLAAINNATGEEVSYEDLTIFCDRWKLPLVKKYDFSDIAFVMSCQEPNKEGFVIKFDKGLRVKVKFAEYKRLHKILTGVSTKTIWELLRNNQNMSEILEVVPDEFYNWVKDTEKKLKKEYLHILKVCQLYLSLNPSLTEAIEYGILSKVASNMKEHKYSSVLFALWKNRNYEHIIWRIIKPVYEKPFTETTKRNRFK